MSEEPVGLLDEVDRAVDRINKAAVVDPRRELVDNLYPLLRLVVETTGHALIAHERAIIDTAQRMEDAEAAIAELATSGDSMILPELAATIDDVLALGLQLCGQALEVADELAETPYDGERVNKVRVLVEAYRASVDRLRGEIDAVTVMDEDDNEGDDNDDDSGN